MNELEERVLNLETRITNLEFQVSLFTQYISETLHNFAPRPKYDGEFDSVYSIDNDDEQKTTV